MKSLAEVSKSTNERVPFGRAPHFIKEMPKGVKTQVELNGKYIFFPKERNPLTLTAKFDFNL